LPKDLPEFISVDLSNLTVINSLHLSDLGLPKGVEIPSLTRGENLPVATIIIPRAVAAEEASAVVAAADIPTTVQKKDADAKEADKKDSGKKK
jgi:large subunit ribosomal protein L25